MPERPAAPRTPAPPVRASSVRTGHAVKETVISLIIAFVFAFVFRGFVIEAFVIPTGSMAPTLLGKHNRFQSPESGATWTVNPWSNDPAGNPLPVQGTMMVTDPMTGARVGQELPATLGRNVPTLSGDRIFVLKYLYSLFDPSRWDVVVFKYPGRAPSDVLVGEQQNYIKRLVGLPGEEIALVDGDVFFRQAAGAAGALPRSDWSAPDWQIARKGERVQRELWMPLYDSRYAPLEPERNLRRWFETPWKGLTPDGEPDRAWRIEDRTAYELDSGAPTVLAWDNETRPITDAYPYNEVPRDRSGSDFAVSDIRMAMGVEPREPGLDLAAVVAARGHEFRAEIGGERIRLLMRPASGEVPGEWRVLEEVETGPAFEPGRVTNVEFWHVDQSLQVWIDGERAAIGTYAWSPALRIEHVFGGDGDRVLGPVAQGNPLADPSLYRQPRVRWEMAGTPLTLHRVRLDRDIFYRPGVYDSGPGQPRHARQGQPSLATHPMQPNLLGPDQFFVAGDNSPNSLDGRQWDTPDPWVYAKIDGTIGVVPRDLLIGKAFFVYFPALHKEKRVPVPDVGRMRFIW